MKELKETEDILAATNPSIDSVAYVRLATKTNTYREILRTVADIRGEKYVAMMFRLFNEKETA